MTASFRYGVTDPFGEGCSCGMRLAELCQNGCDDDTGECLATEGELGGAGGVAGASGAGNADRGVAGASDVASCTGGVTSFD